MNNRIQTAKSIDEIMQFHDTFLNKCLQECLLLLPDLLAIVERLMLLCSEYAAATQRLVSSFVEEQAVPRTNLSKQSMLKEPVEALHRVTGHSKATKSLLSFEREFNDELQKLGKMLSNRSQAEPFLTHLSQWILSFGSEI